jgi:hypothetical protein
MKRNFVIALRRNLFDIAVPSLARVYAQFVVAAAHQQIPGALDVLGGEPFAVVPFDALVQREGQLGPVLDDHLVASSGRIVSMLFHAMR